MQEGQMGWTRNLWNIGYPSLNPRKSFFLKEHWVEIYSNQKAINYISRSNIRTSEETRPPKLHNLLQFSSPSIPDILCPPPSRASWGSAIHVFLVLEYLWNLSIVFNEKTCNNRGILEPK